MIPIYHSILSSINGHLCITVVSVSLLHTKVFHQYEKLCLDSTIDHFA